MNNKASDYIKYTFCKQIKGAYMVKIFIKSNKNWLSYKGLKMV